MARSAKLALWFVSRALGLFALARWLTRGRLKIVCYHGFALGDEAEFRPQLFIKPECFEKRLATIRRYGLRVLPLEDALERLYSARLPANSLVITVDDGFHSFHRIAVPRLQHYEYPATVYVTTYYVEKSSPVFRLVVQYLFWKTRKRELRLRDVPWSPDRVVDLSDPVQMPRATWDCIDYGEQRCDESGRRRICEQLGALLELPYQQIAESRAFHLMSPDELRGLSQGGIQVELHTHRHSFPSDDEAAARGEIADNRAALRRWLPGERSHFCYPSGLWDRRQWPWLDEMEVKSSVTTLPGLNSERTPRHALRRFLDGQHVHHLEFEAALSGFSGLCRQLAAAPRSAVLALRPCAAGRTQADP
jgi:peptidoglycan/xylan/chitin deacetylase (PgdA/CDA1 family)